MTNGMVLAFGILGIALICDVAVAAGDACNEAATAAIDRLLLPVGSDPIYRSPMPQPILLEFQAPDNGQPIRVQGTLRPDQLVVTEVLAVLEDSVGGLPDATMVDISDTIYDTIIGYEPILQSDRYHPHMSRTGLLHALATLHGYTNYLEIGCDLDINFGDMASVPRLVSTCVDPNRGGTHRMTSDDFFAQYQGPPFDLVFIDGLHEHNQVLRDVMNSLSVLKAGGTIVLHDCTPRSRAKAANIGAAFPGGYIWNGDVYRAVMQLRSRLDLEVFVGDFDYGVGIVRRGRNPNPLVLYDFPDWRSEWGEGQVSKEEWIFFKKHEVMLLDLMPVSQFLERTLCSSAEPAIIAEMGLQDKTIQLL
ncbi:hypothetical protein JKP88DRAFT_267798 [Tribonema minus]|uniref:Class I SAM-dependent methyltransferase n=1 Tax=Tribonema minus TaxID=303371 RepID=A0A835Z509_9STRA|nr:hypothetical protein JKP88DRAFT_267798 [Tribonema minus]